MSLTGSGVGGNIGGPSIPLQRDLEATAWTETNKAALGIVHDSIEKAFTEINPRYSTGHFGGFGYRSTSSNPLLDHPIESLKNLQDAPLNLDIFWKSEYESLLSHLPKELLEQLMEEKNKPFEEKKSHFILFDNLLMLAAKFLSNANNSAAPVQDSSLEATRTLLNNLFPFSAMKGALQNGTEVMEYAESFLSQLGPNYRFFDGFNHVLKEMKELLQLIGLVDASLIQTPEGQLTPDAKTIAVQVAERLGVLRSQLERVSLGSDLQFLISTIKGLEIVISALSMENTQSAPLFIALSIASIGIFNIDKGSGLIGPSFQVLSENLLKTLFSSFISENNKAGYDFISMTLPVTFALFIGLTSIAKNSETYLIPQKKLDQLLSAQFFGLQIAVKFIIQSGIFQTLYEEILAISGFKKEIQDLGGEALSQFAYIFLLCSLSDLFKKPLDKLLEEESKTLSQGFASIEQLILKNEKKNDSVPSLSFPLQLSLMALQAQDYEELANSLNIFFKSLGSSEHSLENDSSQIGELAVKIADIISLANPNEEIRGIMSFI